MRIHLNLSLDQQISVLDQARRASGVYLDRNDWYGSRTHQRAVDVILSGESGRRTNQRWRVGDEGVEAATWDQWGIFLAVIFEADPSARCGSAKYPQYADAEDFHRQTAFRFHRNSDEPDFHVLSRDSADYKVTSHRWDYDPAFGRPLSGGLVLTCKGHGVPRNKRADCTAMLVR